MSPPNDTSYTTYYDFDVIQRGITRFGLTNLQNTLRTIYYRLLNHIDRWMISRIIDYIDIQLTDTVYAQHLCGTVDCLVRNGSLEPPVDFYRPFTITEPHHEDLHLALLLSISRVYHRFGHETVIEALSEVFGNVPSMTHIYTYVHVLITHMKDSTFVPEVNEASLLIKNVLDIWYNDEEIDYRPL
jgi:hypothetical protein